MRFLVGALVGAVALTVGVFGWLLRKLDVDLAGVRIP